MKELSSYITEKLNINDVNLDSLPEKLKRKYNLVYNHKTNKYDCNGSIRIDDDLIKNGYFICDFGVVKGSFDCSEFNTLTSLEGAPKEVDGYFLCNRCNNLKSLKGAPEKVGGFFNCEYCKNLESLEGAPEKVENFSCMNCENLKSLKGAPEKVGGYFCCRGCKNLKTLEGAPKEVGGNFKCSDCPQLTDYDIDTKIGGKLIK